MTNDDFLQYENLIHKVINKYRNNKYIEYDDLFQIASIRLYDCFDKYTDDMKQKISFTTYLYNNIEWCILRELSKQKRINAFINISIHEETGEDITIEDMLQDISIDIEAEITDKLVLEEYIREFERVLEGIELDVLNMRVFDNMSYKAIEKVLGLEEKQGYEIFKKAKRKLLNKSSYIKQRYMNFLDYKINMYSDPCKIVLSKAI